MLCHFGCMIKLPGLLPRCRRVPGDTVTRPSAGRGAGPRGSATRQAAGGRELEVGAFRQEAQAETQLAIDQSHQAWYCKYRNSHGSQYEPLEPSSWYLLVVLPQSGVTASTTRRLSRVNDGRPDLGRGQREPTEGPSRGAPTQAEAAFERTSGIVRFKLGLA